MANWIYSKISYGIKFQNMKTEFPGICQIIMQGTRMTIYGAQYIAIKRKSRSTLKMLCPNSSFSTVCQWLSLKYTYAKCRLFKK